MMGQSLAPRTFEALSDEEVVERVLAGNTALYEVVMRRYNTRLYRVARAILKSDVEVEDVLQEAYISAFQHLDQFQGRSKFGTWLTRIAVNEALARMHKADRLEEWDPMKHEERAAESRGRPTPETEAASGELGRLLERSIESLPEGYRAVVMLRDVEGMSTAETAECLSMTEDNVKVRLHRAHAMLRKELFARASLSTAEAFPFHAPRCDRVVAGVFARLGGLRGIAAPER